MSAGWLTKILDSLDDTSGDQVRNYVGASSIGSDCLRQIWYEYKGETGTEIPVKIRRTWDIGKKLEKLVIELLSKCGFEVWEPLFFYDIENPKFQGTIDGMLIKNGMPLGILEIKTAKDASFKIFVKDGLKKWNKKYYAQIQAYLGMSGIQKAFILVLNKDTSEFWDEEVAFDVDYYQGLQTKAKLIIESETMPPRVSSSPVWYQCRTCKFKGICHT